MPAESSNAQGYGLVLVPQPPQVRTIFFAEEAGGNIAAMKRGHRLVFPYHMFCLFYFRNPQYKYILKRCHVVFGQKPFTGLDPEEKFYGLPLRNHDGAFATCFYNWPGEHTAESFAHLIMKEYWFSPYAEYNDWASWWTQRYRALNPSFLGEWTKATKAKDYKWIFEAPMLQPDYIMSLGKLLEANKSHFSQGGIEVVNLQTPTVEGLQLASA